jgi:hypothetical protein
MAGVTGARGVSRVADTGAPYVTLAVGVAVEVAVRHDVAGDELAQPGEHLLWKRVGPVNFPGRVDELEDAPIVRSG